MSVTAKKVEPWYLNYIETECEVYPVTSNNKTVYMIREHYILSQTRQFVQMTAFYEETGDLKTSFAYKTGGGAAAAYASIGRKWMCTKDKTAITDTITGDGSEEQVWEHFSEEVELEKHPKVIRLGSPIVKELTASP
jgi:hypothetical protein